MRHAATVVAVAMLVVAGGALPACAQDEVRQREGALAELLVEKLGKDASPIRVMISGGKVILMGEVESRSVQELAEEVALFADGITSVDNQVTARHDPKLGKGLLTNEAGDSELETTVKMRLRAEIGGHAEKIEVEAVGGWVSLRGVAPEKARLDIALRTAAETKGVTKVIDLLRIAK
jgi:osmotically-inducible protein OsmY